jgi:Domain of unknown function (DUF1902)
MSNSSITIKVAWDPEAKVFYTEYTDLLGLNLEAKTLDEFREKLPGAIQDLTGRQVPFLIELGMPVNTGLIVKRISSNSGLPEAFYPEKVLPL